MIIIYWSAGYRNLLTTGINLNVHEMQDWDIREKKSKRTWNHNSLQGSRGPSFTSRQNSNRRTSLTRTRGCSKRLCWNKERLSVIKMYHYSSFSHNQNSLHLPTLYSMYTERPTGSETFPFQPVYWRNGHQGQNVLVPSHPVMKLNVHLFNCPKYPMKHYTWSRPVWPQWMEPSKKHKTS